MKMWNTIVTGVFVTCFGGTALAYEEITVSDGGTIVGTVKLEGTVPKPKGYNLVTLPDQYYCGRISDGNGWRILQPFQVGPAGEFRDVVVSSRTSRSSASAGFSPCSIPPPKKAQ